MKKKSQYRLLAILIKDGTGYQIALDKNETELVADFIEQLHGNKIKVFNEELPGRFELRA